RSYMRQSGVQVVYPAALARGVTSRAVSGSLPAHQALQQLLQGSGLAVRRVGAEAVTLEATTLAQADSEVIITDTLSVAGDRVDSGASSDEARLLDSYRSVGST
ncbi:STN domain-containing protein, partial [Mesorhizobium sp. M8A.F.Ca.ET.142.01.1.1]